MHAPRIYGLAQHFFSILAITYPGVKSGMGHLLEENFSSKLETSDNIVP